MGCAALEAINGCKPGGNNNGGGCGLGGGGVGSPGQGGGIGGGAALYQPQAIEAPTGEGGGPDWGGVIESYIDPNSPNAPTNIVNGNGQANGTGPYLDYYLTSNPAQENYDLIYDLNDPAVIDMLGGPGRWSAQELTALGHSARHKPPEKQELFFQAVADMAASPEAWSLNNLYDVLMERGYANHSPEYRTTEVPAWWMWAQEGNAYDLPRG